VGTTQIRLDPYKGNSILINGTYMTIPAVGVTLSNTGLSADTNYYIYAYSNSGTLTLEAATTAPQAHTNGMQIKNVDATRTLVGFVRTNASSQFADNAAQRLVRTWFSDQGVVGEKTLGSNTAFNSGSFTELSSSMRIEFLAWEGEKVLFTGSISATHASGANYNARLAVTTVQIGTGGLGTGGAGEFANVVCHAQYIPATSPAGYFYAQIYVADSAGSGDSTAQSGYTGLTMVTSGASA
jgi:hypothetical protein